MRTEAEARANLDNCRTELEAAAANCAELSAAVDAAYERQAEVEERYNRASAGQEAMAANAAHA